MITSFSVVKDGKRFRFVAKDTAKYTREAQPAWAYSCNNRKIASDAYHRNLAGFKQGRK